MKPKTLLLPALLALCLSVVNLHAAEGSTLFQQKLKLAGQGDAKAQTYVALRYDNGRDNVAKNPAEALKWFIAAANQGELSATALAGARLQKQDPVEACKWLILAAANGHANSAKLLAATQKKLTPAQLDDAKQRAAAFKPVARQAAAEPAGTDIFDASLNNAPRKFKVNEGAGEAVTDKDPADHWPVKHLIDKIHLADGITLRPAAPPPGFKHDTTHGLLLNDFIDVSVLHYTPNHRADAVRAIITPKGDYLAAIISGPGILGGRGHYAPPDINYNRKENDLIAYRSADRGKTWAKQGPLFPVAYSLHAFVPLLSKKFPDRIYCFGTEPVPELREDRENAPIAYRYSDDDGRTWTPPHIIRPVNDPDFKGMSCMQMTETTSGAWLIGSHEAHWGGDNNSSNMTGKNFSRIPTREYLLRTADAGKTWNALPGARPNGWFLKDYNRLDEIVPVALDNGRVLALARTPTGFLWQMRSDDNGLTWTDPAPTPIVHPDAPSMFFKLADQKTLMVIHHNISDASKPHFGAGLRKQLWFTLSSDDGATWSEPRLIAASTHADPRAQISYVDIIDDPQTSQFHIFVPYAWRQTLHLTLPKRSLQKMPTAASLRQKTGND